MTSYNLRHLEELESESIYVIREVVAQFENPALLFSGGKDSIVCFHLAKKAFYPASIPFPLVHIDTGHNFKETIEFRDQLKKFDLKNCFNDCGISIKLPFLIKNLLLLLAFG